MTALLFLLQGRMASRLSNENHAVTGAPLLPSTTPYAAMDVWREAVGVVTPHRAQQGLIVTRLLQVFNATGQMADCIKDAVDTVERFQGQQRDVIIASYTLGDPDQIAEEEEFLMSLNRFNVIASRARAQARAVRISGGHWSSRPQCCGASGIPTPEGLGRDPSAATPAR